MTRVRLADIAAHAGVSEATVSRVLNNVPLVSAGTRERVIGSLDVLGYDRPFHPRSQRGVVGLIVPELVNPIFPAYAQVLDAALRAQGYTVVLGTQTAGGMHEDEYTQILIERGAAGIVFVSGHHADLNTSLERYRRLPEAGLPAVLVNGFNPGIRGVPFVSDDDVAAMDIAVRHLTALGHTRIGLAIGQERYVPVRRKVDGFRKACETYLDARGACYVEHTVFSVGGGAAAAIRLLPRGVTAIACGSDLMALGAIAAARTAGLRVPEDVSVVGYDDSVLMAYTDPPLTTLRQDVQGIGSAAVAALMAQIRGDAVPAGEQLFRPELVIRKSTGPLHA